MKTLATASPAETGGVLTTVRYKIDDSSISHIAYMLENQYSDPAKAVVREYGQNARDAHEFAGKADVPVEIHAPTRFDPVFKIRDFGPGLDVEDTERLLCGYGASGDHKRQSDRYTGGFGIGAKVGFALSGQFTYTIWHGGKKRVWTCYKDERMESRAAMMSEEDCSPDETGIEVSVPVPNDKVDHMRNCISTVFQFYDTHPRIMNDDSLTIEPPPSRIMTIKGVTPDVTFHLTNTKDVTVVMGGVAYPVDTTTLDFEKGQFGWTNMLIEAPVNWLQIAPSRESLVYSKYTQDAIRREAANLTVARIKTELEAVQSANGKSLLEKAIIEATFNSMLGIQAANKPGIRITAADVDRIPGGKMYDGTTQYNSGYKLGVGTVGSVYSETSTKRTLLLEVKEEGPPLYSPVTGKNKDAGCGAFVLFTGRTGNLQQIYRSYDYYMSKLAGVVNPGGTGLASYAVYNVRALVLPVEVMGDALEHFAWLADGSIPWIDDDMLDKAPECAGGFVEKYREGNTNSRRYHGSGKTDVAAHSVKLAEFSPGFGNANNSAGSNDWKAASIVEIGNMPGVKYPVVAHDRFISKWTVPELGYLKAAFGLITGKEIPIFAIREGEYHETIARYSALQSLEKYLDERLKELADQFGYDRKQLLTAIDMLNQSVWDNELAHCYKVLQLAWNSGGTAAQLSAMRELQKVKDLFTMASADSKHVLIGVSTKLARTARRMSPYFAGSGLDYRTVYGEGFGYPVLVTDAIKALKEHSPLFKLLIERHNERIESVITGNLAGVTINTKLMHNTIQTNELEELIQKESSIL